MNEPQPGRGVTPGCKHPRAFLPPLLRITGFRSWRRLHPGPRVPLHSLDARRQLRAAHEARAVPVGLVVGRKLGEVPLRAVGELPQVLQRAARGESKRATINCSALCWRDEASSGASTALLMPITLGFGSRSHLSLPSAIPSRTSSSPTAAAATRTCAR